MYKILVVASTEHVLKFKSLFSQNGFSFDYLIVEKNKSSYDFGQFDQQKINVNSEMINVQNSAEIPQTAAHQKMSNLIQAELTKLKQILYQGQKYLGPTLNPKKIINPQNSSDLEFTLDQVIDLSINAKTKKIHLEIKNSKVFDYDHIYIEESYLTFKRISTLFPNNNFFTYKNENIFQMVGLHYQSNVELGQYKYWLMVDSDYKSIYDNFYFLKTSGKTVDVWAWLPAGQLTNFANVSYLSERIQKRIENKYNFMTLKAGLNEMLLQPLNTHIDVSNKQKSMISFIPHFYFYNQSEIVQVILKINTQTIDKLKINKEFITKIPTETLNTESQL